MPGNRLLLKKLTMKKFRLIGVLFCALAFAAKPASAQFGNAYTFPLVAGDTLNNVDSVFKTFTTTAGYSEIGIAVNLTKISGTVAGNAVLYGSMDGITFYPTDSANYVVPLTSSYSTPTVTNVAYFSKSEAPWTTYLVVAKSTGTVSAQVRVKYTLRKHSVIQTYN